MAKMVSYNFAQGQLFYSKTGRRVPDKYQKALVVDITKKGVYKNGRKVGSLKQKNLTKKAVATRTRSLKKIKKNMIKGVYVSRVKTTTHFIAGSPIAGAGLLSEEVFAEKADIQSVINFELAISGLIDLKIMTESEGREWVIGYEQATKAARAEMWVEIRAMYNDVGVEY